MNPEEFIQTVRKDLFHSIEQLCKEHDWGFIDQPEYKELKRKALR